MAALIVLASIRAADANSIWLDARSTQQDWGELFTQAPAWSAVAKRVVVYSTSNELIERESDADVTRMASDLAARKIALAIDLQSIVRQPGQVCGGLEGYGLLREDVAGAAKLHRLGIMPQFVVLDEPLWFGHFDADKAGCRLSVTDLARAVAASIQAYLVVFPHATVGDIEPFPAVSRQPGWQKAYRSFSERLSAGVGSPLSFLQADIGWRTPGWLAAVQNARTLTGSLGQRFGVIYDGDGDETSGLAWVNDAITNFVEVEGRGGIMPDQAVFETWDPQPPRVLPETDPDTLSHVLEVYQRPRTKITARRVGSFITGQVRDVHGSPVAKSSVTVETAGSVESEPPPMRIVHGVVPDKARFGIMGLRVNSECSCAGSNDLLIGAFSYTEAGVGARAARFSVPQATQARDGQPWPGAETRTVSVKGVLDARVVVTADQRLLLNSPAFAVTPGAAFSFRAPIGSLDGGGLFGSVTLVWLDADHHGFARQNITFARDTEIVGRASTDSAGRFTLPAPAAGGGRPRAVSVLAASTPETRGTSLDLR